MDNEEEDHDNMQIIKSYFFKIIGSSWIECLWRWRWKVKEGNEEDNQEEEDDIDNNLNQIN